MLIDHKKYELFGKTLIQKIALKPPFKYPLPISDNACYIYVLIGNVLYNSKGIPREIPTDHSLFLNCLNSIIEIGNTKSIHSVEFVVINFHPAILKRIYDTELTSLLLQPKGVTISNKSTEIISNDYLIQKYMDGVLFYFNNPSLVNESILVLKLKEIILLLYQTKNAEAVRLILSQIFSPTIFTFKQIIEAHLFLQVGIEELAQKTNLSVSSFKREFTKLYKDSPANYFKTKKLEKAAELLLASDNPISDIAFKCGFNDLANFSKSFRGQYNASPTNYRLTRIAK